MQVNKIKTYGGHRYCWDKFWPGANGSVNKVTWKESDRKCKTSICDLYTIFQSTSVSPNPFLVNTAHAFRYMGLNLTFWPLLVIFEKHCQNNNFLIFSNHLAFLVEQIVTDNVDIEK